MSEGQPTGDLDLLLVEDNPGDARLVEEMLREGGELHRRVGDEASTADGTEIHHEERLSAGLDRLSAIDVDAVLLDLGLPDSSGLDTLAAVVEATAFVPIVVLTGLRDEAVGIEAIQHGAQDYLVKDELTSDLLVRSIHHAIERAQQESEQERRREQLEALNELTRELMSAETPVEVSEYVVDAAEGMLDLPVAGIALYDDQEGVLRPTEMTAAAAEIVDAMALLDGGDGAGWRAFTANETYRSSLQPDEQGGSDLLSASEVAVFPLANHGILVVGATARGGFSPIDFDFVETVAGNVEATFDRVNREQQLHEREEMLNEQNRTLERLSRVNDIIRNIAQGLVQASTREEIETVVCEQLADVGPYELAWVGEHDMRTEVIRPRESAGNEKGYLESVTVKTDGGPKAGGPIGRAVETREPQVVNDVLQDASFEPWRREALERGYHAAMALPLIYGETFYGVLNVYTGQPGVFDDLEQAVLTELADTIAYAINAVESKKALVSDEVTRLTFTVTDSNLEFVVLSREFDCDLTVESLVPRSDGGIRGFFTTRGTPPADVLEFAHRLPSEDLTLVSEYEEGGEPVGLFEADLTDESLVTTVLKHGGQTHTIDIKDGVGTVTVELAADSNIPEFVDMFQTRYPDSELVSQRSIERPRRSTAELRASLTESLTDRQLEALQTAYFGGFFETPRERTGTDIADSMGISQPTFNTHLRAAQRKLCQKLFREGPHQD